MTTTPSLDKALTVSALDNPRITVAFTQDHIALAINALTTRIRSERGHIASQQVLTHLLGVFREGRPTVKQTFKLTDTLVGYLVDTLAWYGPRNNTFHHELSTLRKDQ